MSLLCMPTKQGRWSVIWQNLLLAITVLTTTIPWGNAHGTTWETLIMPGEVIEGHAEYEFECNKCHEAFDKKQQTRLCRECHEEVDQDLRRHEGFHGKNEEIRNAKCKQCHTEHIGRQADVVQLDRDTFDHNATDFKLTGKHSNVRCALCHKSDKKFRDAPHKCIDCHKDDDQHDGRLGEQCDDCHTEKGWAEAKFDHDETDFPLKGKHQDVQCNDCHPNQRYEDISTACYACHRLDDVHTGLWGEKCQDCHNEEDWEEIDFDHDQDTDFELTGQHRDLECETCHTDQTRNKDMGTTCFDCHENDDEHLGRNGKKCEDCHTTDDWAKEKFDHDEDTDFPLEGKHQKVVCLACHRGVIGDEELDTHCYACHEKDDVHSGQEGKQCERCHNESGWGEDVIFDHDLTRFPLIGLHSIVPCEECHLSTDYQSATTECNDCHEPDDIHERRLGPHCARCHNPNDWALWRFDHNRDTDYKLDGAHEGLDCHGCHNTPVKKSIELSDRCVDCHWRDDIHAGAYGRQCDRCHSTESFEELSIGN